MNKLVVEGNDDKKIITFTISKEQKVKLKSTLITSEKYNLKKKSDWVNEAIGMLRDNPSHKELILNSEGRQPGYVFDKVYMTFEQRCFFADFRSEVVKANPDIKGPQGAIIRAAVFSRLFRNV